MWSNENGINRNIYFHLCTGCVSADTAQQAVNLLSCQTVSLAINMSNTEKLGSTIIFPLLLEFSRLLPGDSVTQSGSVWTLLTHSHNLGVFGRRRVQ